MDDTTRDPVTGLLNRVGLIAQLESLVRRGPDASMAIVDLVRPMPGGVAPARADDRTLRLVARLLRTLSEPDGVACHLAGDEFVVLADVDDDVALGEFVVDQLRGLRMLLARPGEVTAPVVSVGTAPVRRGMTASQVLGLANDAVCDAKLALTA